jgi:hypothetical protein
MDLLGLFANQAAVGLDLLQRARKARAALDGEGNLSAIARIAASIDGTENDEKRAAGIELLRALEQLLA